MADLVLDQIVFLEKLSELERIDQNSVSARERLTKLVEQVASGSLAEGDLLAEIKSLVGELESSSTSPQLGLQVREQLVALGYLEQTDAVITAAGLRSPD